MTNTARTTLEPKRSWCDRSEMASLFLRPGDSVCDLGAGSHTLRRFLPGNVRYIPVDRSSDVPGTWVVDLDQPDFVLPPEPFNVVTALGLLNYLDDLERFMARLEELCGGHFIIFTYDFWNIDTTDFNQPIRNSFKELDEGMPFFARFVQDLTPAVVFRRRVMFTGTLGRGGTSNPPRSSATRLACRNIRPQEYLAIKIFGLEMMPRWLA